MHDAGQIEVRHLHAPVLVHQQVGALEVPAQQPSLAPVQLEAIAPRALKGPNAQVSHHAAALRHLPCSRFLGTMVPNASWFM